MKRLFFILISTVVFLGACKKQPTVRTSGTDTIDNLRYQTISYHVYGFSFSQAKLIATNTTPAPDIIIDLVYKDGTPPSPALQTNNLLASFLKIGEYDTEDEAKEVFDNLKTITAIAISWSDMAEPVAPNQIWVYRSNDEKYTKIRIKEVKIDKLEEFVDYAECTFQWVHQPDGSLSFP